MGAWVSWTWYAKESVGSAVGWAAVFCCSRRSAVRSRRGNTTTLYRTHWGYYEVNALFDFPLFFLGFFFWNLEFFLNSMDVHPSRELVASGQRAGADRKSQAHVRIWSTESLQTLYVFGMGELNIGITAVAFSQLVSFASLNSTFDYVEN